MTQTTPSGRDQSIHIGIYGRTNTGKSTLMNRMTGQQVSIVSPQAGTTTDPVRRSYEIMGLGPVVWIDTAGIDDSDSELGRQRIEKTMATLQEIDLAVFLLSGDTADTVENDFLGILRANDIPTIILTRASPLGHPARLAERMKEMLPVHAAGTLDFYGGRLAAGDTVILVCPIDDAAPTGRLILPQVQALRAALDLHALAVTVQLEELPRVLGLLPTPRLVVTDSQLFKEVSEVIPSETELTSFSILLAHQKGDPQAYQEGLLAVDCLRNGDRVLIVENCSHQVTCDDIGRTKIPGWLRKHSPAEELSFTFVSGRDPLPADVSEFALAVLCGGCVSTSRMVRGRIRALRKAGVPVTNYGMLIRKLRVEKDPSPSTETSE